MTLNKLIIGTMLALGLVISPALTIDSVWAKEAKGNVSTDNGKPSMSVDKKKYKKYPGGRSMSNAEIKKRFGNDWKGLLAQSEERSSMSF